MYVLYKDECRLCPFPPLSYLGTCILRGNANGPRFLQPLYQRIRVLFVSNDIRIAKITNYTMKVIFLINVDEHVGWLQIVMDNSVLMQF
jgi:hypothetical protein